MKKYKYSNVSQELFCEELPNGLKVSVIPIPDKKNFYAVLGVRFGSGDLEFVPFGKEEFIKVPCGIAHFLEHKAFEMENGEDPFSVFSKTGASTNASTSFYTTKYYAWGIESPYENIDYLLKFVFSPYFTKENIQKEQGIIGEEIKMYDDNPSWVIDDISRQMVFKELPIRERISGTIEDISKITPEDLYNCYNTFYVPNNMYLIVGGNVTYDKVMKVVKNNQALKEAHCNYNIIRKTYHEEDQVLSEYKEKKMNVFIPKVKYIIKINRNRFSIKEQVKLDMYLNIIGTVVFGTTSTFYEKIRNENIANSCYVDHNYYGNYYTCEFDAESDKADLLKDEIDKTLRSIHITKGELQRIKRVWIASEIKMTDSADMIVENTYDDILYYGAIYHNRIEIIQGLNMKELNQVIKEIGFDNSCFILINPKEENINSSQRTD